MTAGRPKEFNDEVLEKAASYLGQCDDHVPSVAGLALYMGISRPTVYDWKSQYEKFSYIVEEIMATQESKLLNGGLGGEFNASISKLMLTKHGYSDKVETDNKTAIDLSGLTDEQLQAMANE